MQTTDSGVSDTIWKERRIWTEGLREAKRGRVRHGSLGNIEDLWKRKKEETKREECFNKSKKNHNTGKEENGRKGMRRLELDERGTKPTRILLDSITSLFVHLKRHNSFALHSISGHPVILSLILRDCLRLRSYVDTLLHVSETFAIDRRDRLFNKYHVGNFNEQFFDDIQFLFYEDIEVRDHSFKSFIKKIQIMYYL